MTNIPDFSDQPTDESSFEASGAYFGENPAYRYTLFRRWKETGRMVNFIMLNPSTANETENDPTVRRCIWFAKEWGYTCLQVTNIFAIRTTSPKEMISWYKEGKNVVGDENDAQILKIACLSQLVVCAWGNHGSLSGRGMEVKRLLDDAGVELNCLGLTDEKQPRHPLYLSKQTELDFF